MDELDQLIEGVLNEEGDSGESPEAEESPVETDATESTADPQDQEDSTPEGDSDLEIPQEESLPEEGEEESDPEQPDGTDNPPAVDPGPSPDVLKLQQQVQQQQAFIRSVIEEAKAEQEKQKQQDQENEYKKLLEQWDEMDPDEARRQQVAYIAERASERDKALRSENDKLRHELTTQKHQQEQAQYSAAEEQAKATVVDHLSKQHKLTEFEQWTMSQFTTPAQMEAFAQRAQDQRKTQTQAAREAKRKELEANPALKGGDPGSGTPQVKLDPPTTPEELIDRLFQ